MFEYGYIPTVWLSYSLWKFFINIAFPYIWLVCAKKALTWLAFGCGLFIPCAVTAFDAWGIKKPFSEGGHLNLGTSLTKWFLLWPWRLRVVYWIAPLNLGTFPLNNSLMPQASKVVTAQGIMNASRQILSINLSVCTPHSVGSVLGPIKIVFRLLLGRFCVTRISLTTSSPTSFILNTTSCQPDRDTSLYGTLISLSAPSHQPTNYCNYGIP